MNHLGVSVGMFDGDHFQRDAMVVEPEEDHEIAIPRVGRVERTDAVLHHVARPTLGDPVSGG